MSIAFSTIKKAVALRFGISIEKLDGKCQRAIYAAPRHVAMYLGRELTQLSTTKLGKMMGNRDHTTIMHGAKKVRDIVAVDPDFAAMVEDMKRGLSV